MEGVKDIEKLIQDWRPRPLKPKPPNAEKEDATGQVGKAVSGKGRDTQEELRSMSTERVDGPGEPAGKKRARVSRLLPSMPAPASTAGKSGKLTHSYVYRPRPCDLKLYQPMSAMECLDTRCGCTSGFRI